MNNLETETGTGTRAHEMEGEQKGGLVSSPPPDALRRPYMSCPRFSNSAGALANFRAGGLARGASRVWGSLHRPRAVGTNLHSGPGIRRNPLTAPHHEAPGPPLATTPAGTRPPHVLRRRRREPASTPHRAIWSTRRYRTHLSDGDSARHKGCKQKSH